MVAEITKETIKRTHELGSTVHTVTLDGTSHNVSAFNLLGARMFPEPWEKEGVRDTRPFFTHPQRPEIQIGCHLDYVHMIKVLLKLGSVIF